MEAVAEGVESADQLDFLAEAGCAYAQGFYISRPIQASLFTSYLHSQGTAGEKRAEAV